jgi:hypothetical protein
MDPYMPACMFVCRVFQEVDNVSDMRSLLKNNGNLLLLLILLLLFLLSSLFRLLLSFLCLAFARMHNPFHLPSLGRSSRPQKDGNCPQGTSPPTRLGHFRRLLPGGHTHIMPPHLVKTGIFYSLQLCHPGPAPRYLLRWGLHAWSSCSGPLPIGLSIMCLPYQGFGNNTFSTRGAWGMIGWTSTSRPQAFEPAGCLTLVLRPQRYCT